MKNKSLMHKFYTVMFLAILAIPVVFIIVNYSMLIIYTIAEWLFGFDSPFSSSVLYANLYLLFFTALALFVILGSKHFRKTVDRINEIQKTVANIAMDESVPDKLEVDHSSNDEINHLAKSINVLIDRLRYKEMKLAEQERQKGEYLKQLSHDINTPLTALNLELYQFSKDHGLTGSMAPFYEKVNYVSKLVDKVTLASQNDIDNYYIFKEDIDMTKTVEQSLMKWSYLLDKNNIEVNINSEEQLNWSGDRLWFDRLLNNIISNIYMHSGTKTIDINIDDQLLIRDYGSGFEMEQEAQVGSGSAVIKSICDKFNIYLDISSNSEGTLYGMKQCRSSSEND